MRRSSRLLAAASRDATLGIFDATSVPSAPSALSASPAVASASRTSKTVEKVTANGWTPLCSARELSCAVTLESGQVFAWKRHSKQPKTWLGVVGRRVFALRECDDLVHFQCLHPSDLPISDGVGELTHYFRLDVNADLLYERWTTTSDRMSATILKMRGLRIVRQDPVECLFSFICSSNNHIARIQGMVDKLKVTYGDLIYKEKDDDDNCFYAFPSVDTLAAKCKEETLRALGFGYRAAFIVKTAKQLQKLGGASYLHDIRKGKSVRPKGNKKAKLNDETTVSYHEYQDELMVFAGVGRKVADCVALFSLEKMEAIPVDTHVWQIACRELDVTLSNRKSITPTVYRMVGDLFRTRFAPQAGWAHSVLFAGDLSAFKFKVSGQEKKPRIDRKSQKPATKHEISPKSN